MVVFFINYYFLQRDTEELPYNKFLKFVDEGKVSSVVIEDSRIMGELKPIENNKLTRFVTVAVKDDTLTQKLYEKGVSFKGQLKNPLVSFFASWVFPLIFFYFLWSFIIGRAGGAVGSGVLSMSKSKAKIYVEKEVKTTFKDVAGIDEASDELQEIVRYLQDPKRYARLGGHAPKGVLLVGPPGTGKTLLARAVAGEAKVPFFSINGSEFVEMFVGLGAARVRDMFQQAKEQVPCIVFIDEIDALGRSRAMNAIAGTNDEKEQTLNQLLAEMDGFDSSEGVIIFAATNRPEILDPALLRAGRFDRQIALNNPDHEGRLQILKVHVKKIKLDPTVDLNRISSMTSGFSGADLANLSNEAALVATRRDALSVIENDFLVAIERMVAGLEQKKKVMNPLEKRKTAFHELGHATVALALEVPDKVHKVTIIPRGMGALGYTMQRPEEDRYLLEESELIAKIAVLLGGRAAEKIFFNSTSTGASNDLAKATDIARAMVMQFGMGTSLGMASYDQKRSRYLSTPFDGYSSEMSEETSREVELEIKKILNSGFETAIKSIRENKKFIDLAVIELLKKETLDEKEIQSFWGIRTQSNGSGLTVGTIVAH